MLLHLLGIFTNGDYSNDLNRFPIQNFAMDPHAQHQKYRAYPWAGPADSKRLRAS
jgi:hypothetical protein